MPKQPALHIVQFVRGRKLIDCKFDAMKEIVSQMVLNLRRHPLYDAKPDHKYKLHLTLTEEED